MALRISREVLELVYCRNHTFYKLHYGADVRVFLPAHVKPLKQIEIDFTTFICKINDIKQGNLKRWITNKQTNKIMSTAR